MPTGYSKTVTVWREGVTVWRVTIWSEDTFNQLSYMIYMGHRHHLSDFSTPLIRLYSIFILKISLNPLVFFGGVFRSLYKVFNQPQYFSIGLGCGRLGGITLFVTYAIFSASKLSTSLHNEQLHQTLFYTFFLH